MVSSFSQKRAEKQLRQKGYVEVSDGFDKLFNGTKQYTVIHKDNLNNEINRYFTESNCPTMALNQYCAEVLIGKMNDGDSLQVLYGHVE
jgi:hypothetical protein